MGPNIPGVPMPPYGGGGGGRRRKRKKRGGFVRELLGAVFIALAVFALPYLFEFSPGDVMAFDSAVGLEKIEAFRDGLRHKREISEMTFSHNGRSIAFTDEGGTLTGIEAEGYDYDEADEMEADIDEARRLLKEWGLDG